MPSADPLKREEILAIKLHQWLTQWQKVEFDPAIHRREPEHFFYLFALSAKKLKALTGIQRRTTKGGLLRSEDLGIQRTHEVMRSEKIADFVQHGYPWSDLNEKQRLSGQYDDLRKPGWLPTAIVVNILKPDDVRFGGATIAPDDVISVSELGNSTSQLQLPAGFKSGDWLPQRLYPIEVIDGQHRLWAFEEAAIDADFELPVVAFHGLDISWQAYLFWTINITPKRINPSFAFDLQPLLRTEDWLDRFGGHAVYRETRAQELTENLWANSESPWQQHINMLGEAGSGVRMVSQAAWIRSLMATYVRRWENPHIGGLFGTPLGSDEQVLPWSRPQQAAFLIAMGRALKDEIATSRVDWAENLRSLAPPDMFAPANDPAFSGPYSLLNTDQGIRGLLHVTNDFCYLRSQDLRLADWGSNAEVEEADFSNQQTIEQALQTLAHQPVFQFLESIARCLATYDWRTSSTPNLPEESRRLKAAFRGSGGYRELRIELLRHLEGCKGDIAKTARDVINTLGIA